MISNRFKPTPEGAFSFAFPHAFVRVTFLLRSLNRPNVGVRPGFRAKKTRHSKKWRVFGRSLIVIPMSQTVSWLLFRNNRFFDIIVENLNL